MMLELILKKQWFDLIESGQKPEEYRDFKEYWLKRLCVLHPGAIGGDFMDNHKVGAYTFKEFTHVRFRHGYGKLRPSFLREIDRISIGTGRPEWGAEPGKKYFIIHLKPIK